MLVHEKFPSLMQYLLYVQVIGSRPEIIITAEQFEALQSASRVLTSGGAIEDKFELLLSNYLDLEKAVLSLSAEDMVRCEVSYQWVFEARMTLNRMLVNLLTSTRLYIDHLPHHTGEILGKGRGDEVCTEISREYDADFRYRFMDSLRNYVQHRGFPVHNIRFGGRIEDGVRRNFVFSLEFSSLRQQLLDDKKFKKAVLQESPDTIDLKACCRYYVERLSAIHCAVRNQTKPLLNSARALFERTIAEYQAEYKRKPIGLAAVRRNAEGKVDARVPVLLDWDDIRQRLRERNNELVNLRDRCVTSAIKPSVKQ